jgi:DNA-binding NtrC family response regulator
LPPLRERGQDIIVLANHFLETYVDAHPEFAGKMFTSEARRTIMEYAWPGNVRELKSAIERAILIADIDAIHPPDLMLHDRTMISPWSERSQLSPSSGTADRANVYAPQPVVAGHGIGGESVERVAGVSLGDNGSDIVSLEELKQRAVERAYRLCDGNVDKAAVELGIGRATMYRLLKKYNLTD